MSKDESEVWVLPGVASQGVLFLAVVGGLDRNTRGATGAGSGRRASRGVLCLPT